MELATGIGISNHEEAYEAGLEAASAARKQVGVGDVDLVLIFATIGYALEDILEAVGEEFGDTPMSGATFEGIIGRDVADESLYAVQIAALRSSTVHFKTFSSEHSIEQPLAAGESLGRQIDSARHAGNAVVFLFPDFRSNITGLFQGIERHSPIPLIGGASGDNLRFQ